ncbi:MAG: hypothetical protein KGI59_02615, partial [Patescibacteria group bacterium]|nr:hypothetical protein [Patescibacteria group bacterium]
MRLNTQSPIFLLAILFLSGMSLIYVVSADVVPGSIVAQPPLRRISRESAPSIVAAAFPMFSGRTQVAALEGAGSGLVGWWKFDEGSGTTAADSSGSGNTGTLVGGPTWTTGQIGGALSFNGTNQYVTASTNSMPASAQAVSISAWVFISQYPNSKSSIVWRGSTSAGGGFGDPRIFALTLEGASNNVPVFYAESAGSGGLYYDATSSVSIGTGSWHLITGTSDGSGHLAIYVDGSSAGAQGPFLGFSSGSADSTVYVGADNSRSSLEDYFPGRVDDVRIYNRALSAQEVSVLYAEASSGPLPTPTPTLTPTPTPTPTATPPLQSAYYVDASRTSNGDGSANNPWRLIEDIDWAKVQSSLNSTSVSIYFSSRSTWDNDGSLTVKATGSASAMLTLDGSTYYNSVSSGPAQWVLESTPGNRASFSNSTVTGGSMYINNDTHYVTVRGFSLLHPTWGGINIGQSNPSINIDHIVVDDVSIDSPQNNHGVWGGWLESGVHDITVENSIIKNTPLEGIYIGHYNYLQNSITGVVIRNNILIDVGSPAGGGSASINVKPPDIGAVVSGNAIYRTTTSTGAGCGIFFAADGGQIYDNTIHGITHVNQNVCGGHGIFLTSDGDGVGNGHAITSALIYNNLIYGNDGSAISVSATTNTPGADVTGIRIYNNTLWRNGLSTSRGDIDLSSFSPRSIQVTDVRNNIIGNLSGNPYVKTYNTTAHIVASDDNIYNT